MTHSADALQLGGEKFSSRLFIGTGKFPSGESLEQVVHASETQLVTVAMKRANPKVEQDSILKYLSSDKIRLLPNTSGVRNAKEAVFVAPDGSGSNGDKLVKIRNSS